MSVEPAANRRLPNAGKSMPDGAAASGKVVDIDWDTAEASEATAIDWDVPVDKAPCFFSHFTCFFSKISPTAYVRRSTLGWGFPAYLTGLDRASSF